MKPIDQSVLIRIVNNTFEYSNQSDKEKRLSSAHKIQSIIDKAC